MSEKTDEEEKQTEKTPKTDKLENSVILSIFEVGFESVAEALGVFHKLFLLLFQYLTNKHRQPFSSTYFIETVSVNALFPFSCIYLPVCSDSGIS